MLKRSQEAFEVGSELRKLVKINIALCQQMVDHIPQSDIFECATADFVKNTPLLIFPGIRAVVAALSE